MSDSVQPHRWQPTRLPGPWDSQGKNTGVGCHFLLQCMKVKMKSLSHVQLLATLWTAAYQAPLSMGFSRQVYWSGVPLPSPRLDIAKENFWARGYTNGILKNQKAKRIETVKIAENIQRLWKKLKKVWHIHNRNTRLYIRDRNWRFIWNNNNWEFSQFNIRKQTTYPRNSENIKQNEFQ